MNLISIVFAFVLLIGCAESADGKGKPTLMAGRIANPADFPASVWIGNCTATAIGKNVLITAAHCVGGGGKVSYALGPHRYSAQCRIAKEYQAGDSTADYALCKSTTDMTGVEFETVNTDPALVKVSDEVLLSGFGCQRWGGGIDGKYRIGESKVIRVPSGGNNDYITRNGATLCSGDSGGPAWALDSSKQRTKLISVNSRSNTRDTSYVSSISTPEAKRFIKSWMALEKGSVICGITVGAKNCRGVKPTPPKEEKFEIDHEVAKVNVTMKSKYALFVHRVKQDINRWILDYWKDKVAP